MKSYIPFILLLFLIFSCNHEKEKTAAANQEQQARTVNVPTFNADSAYFFVKKQVDFGPRVPDTKAHKQTGDYLVGTLEKFGAKVTSQEFESTTFDAHKIHLRNIIGSFSPEKKKRVILASHWDTRPFADKDDQYPNAPFDGANDGASGVGILLEIARIIHTENDPDVGLDIILFDGEDWGEKEGFRTPPPAGLDSWWCLGSQYWAKNKHIPGYSAYYGILLDMAGGKNAQFYREELSLTYAPKIVEKVWDAAERLGYSHIFVKKNEGQLIDDHKYVNEIAKIPMIDIVNYDPATGSFGDFHHTTLDNMDIISEETLKAVGTTLLYVIYSEEPGI